MPKVKMDFFSDRSQPVSHCKKGICINHPNNFFCSAEVFSFTPVKKISVEKISGLYHIIIEKNPHIRQIFYL